MHQIDEKQVQKPAPPTFGDARKLQKGPRRNLLANAVANTALGVLWVYKRTLSPVFYFFGARCRHYPTCSDYAAEAFSTHNPWVAFWLTLSRLSRCHPFGSHGIDPVPATIPKAGWRFWRLGDWAWTERGAEKQTRR